jgi:hypothetical protein
MSVALGREHVLAPVQPGQARDRVRDARHPWLPATAVPRSWSSRPPVPAVPFPAIQQLNGEVVLGHLSPAAAH